MKLPQSTESFNEEMERLMGVYESRRTAAYLQSETEAVARANGKIAQRSWRNRQ